MKRILAAALLALSGSAHAEVVLMALAQNAAGGTVAVFSGVDDCKTGIGVLIKVPFAPDDPGCVTRIADDRQSFHVFYKSGTQIDYPYDGWTFFPQKHKGAV